MEQDVLTVVPPDLKKLVRLVARAFYLPEQFLVLDILARYPCVTEDDLHQLLRFELKKLRGILAFLKKDKLIKNIQRVEAVNQESSDREKRNVTVQYYYINYKVFVNVVKFKLHRIREKIHNDEKKSRNNMLYVCPNCQNSFTDLDVDRLLDPVEQVLKCTMCRCILEQDVPEENVMDARSLLSSLNEQLQPIQLLLKQTESINLAPEVLEPEPHGINKQVLEASVRHRGQQQGPKSTDQWTTSRADDMYGDQAVSVDIGDGSEKSKKGKAAPQWMTESTVYKDSGKMGGDNIVAMETNIKGNVSDGDIMALLLNETKGPAPSNPLAPPTRVQDEDTSSSSEEEEDSSSEEEMERGGEGQFQLGAMPYNSQTQYSDQEEDESEFESDEDDFSVKVGGKLYQISDITPDIVAQMTAEEKQKYTEIYQQAYSNYI